MIEEILQNNKNTFASIFPFNLQNEIIFELNLSVNNKELYKLDLSTTTKLSEYINKKRKDSNSDIIIGGYAEDRLIYRKSEHFEKGKDARTIHLGVDIWCKVNTSVFAPINGKIHSFKNNVNFGDYGPTIILEHNLEGLIFYTLYGHLSVKSLQNIKTGKRINKGEKFAEIGDEKENGNWPPHLHFQIISDMLGKKGDFPGVASKKDKSKFLHLCPNPNLILNI